jgi:predicted RNA-binding Zn ribbon-like protein
VLPERADLTETGLSTASTRAAVPPNGEVALSLAVPSGDPCLGELGVGTEPSVTIVRLLDSYTIGSMGITGQVDFNSHTDEMVAVAVRLVNRLASGERRGRAYVPPDSGARRAVLAEIGADGLSEDDADGLAEIAGELRVVFEAVAAGDMDAAAHAVNRLLAETRARPYLDRHDGQQWHLHYHGTEGTPAAAWGAGCATALAVVLGGEYRDRLGVCTAPRCDRVYVDTSRNGTRRFCGAACQNRVKTAAFRARAR